MTTQSPFAQAIATLKPIELSTLFPEQDLARLCSSQRDLLSYTCEAGRLISPRGPQVVSCGHFMNQCQQQHLPQLLNLTDSALWDRVLNRHYKKASTDELLRIGLVVKEEWVQGTGHGWATLRVIVQLAEQHEVYIEPLVKMSGQLGAANEVLPLLRRAKDLVMKCETFEQGLEVMRWLLLGAPKPAFAEEKGFSAQTVPTMAQVLRKLCKGLDEVGAYGCLVPALAPEGEKLDVKMIGEALHKVHAQRQGLEELAQNLTELLELAMHGEDEQQGGEDKGSEEGGNDEGGGPKGGGPGKGKPGKGKKDERKLQRDKGRPAKAAADRAPAASEPAPEPAPSPPASEPAPSPPAAQAPAASEPAPEPAPAASEPAPGPAPAAQTAAEEPRPAEATDPIPGSEIVKSPAQTGQAGQPEAAADSPDRPAPEPDKPAPAGDESAASSSDKPAPEPDKPAPAGEEAHDDHGGGEAAQPQPQSPPEHWIASIACEVKAVASPDEQTQLGGHLFLALAGRPPAQLLSLVRGLLPRLREAPDPILPNLHFWLKNVSGPDREARWACLYYFFVFAQLPGFRTHLHCLYLVEIPARSLLGIANLASENWESWPFAARRAVDISPQGDSTGPRSLCPTDS